MMKENLEDAVMRAEEIIDHVRSRPSRQRYSTPPSAKWKSLPQKLYDMYIEEIQKDPENKKVRYGCHLLDKLANREKLQWQCMIVNLYPANQGYSLVLPAKTIAESETVKLPYAESEFLDFIDNEELPPILVELVEQTHPFLFYNGCVIAEVKDYRQSPNGQSYASRHVLLRPTQQSVVADVNAIASDGHLWTMDDKIQLESQLVLATQSPLCLDPSMSVCCVANKLHNEKHRFNTKSIRRCLKRYSQVAKNRKAVQRRMPAPPELLLHDFLSKRKSRNSILSVDLKIGKPGVDLWQQRPLDIQKIDTLNVLELASCPDKPKMINDNTPITIEEIILETERSNGKIHHAKLTIQQRLSDSCYLGELYSDKDHNSKEGRRLGATTKFLLGTRHNAQRYLNQFQDLHTEEGRRPVKITRKVHGHAAQVIQSANYPHAPSSLSVNHEEATNTQQKSSGPNTAKADPTPEVDYATSQAKRSRRVPPPPLKLAVSLTNPASLSTNYANNTHQMKISGGNIQNQQMSITGQGQSNSQSFTSQQALNILHQQGNNRPQPPAYLSLNRSCNISTDGSSISQSPVGTPTSTPVSVTVGAQLGFASLPGSISAHSIPQSLKSPPPPATPPPPPRHTPTPTILRRLSMDDRTIQGSMPPPSATPPMLASTSATPPPPSPKALLGASTGQEISLANVTQASLAQAGVAVALTMDGNSIALPITGLVNHSQSGLVQSSSNLINTQIGVMTSLGNLISTSQGIVPLQTTLANSTTSTIAITNTTQAKLNNAQLLVGKSPNIVNLSGIQSFSPAEVSQLLTVLKNAQTARTTGGNQQLQNVSVLQLPTTTNIIRNQNISQNASTVASIRQAAKTQQRQQIVYNTSLQQHTPHLNTVLQQQQQLQQQTFQTNQTQTLQVQQDTQIQRAGSAQLLTGTNLTQLAQLPLQQAIQQQQQMQQQQQLQQQQQRQQQLQQQIAAQQAFSKHQQLQLWQQQQQQQQHKVVAAVKPKAKKKK